MPLYIANKNLDDKGYHEIHEASCFRLPDEKNQLSIGRFTDCPQAILAAKSSDPTVKYDGCYFGCPGCHRG